MGGPFKELVFELGGGTSRVGHVAYVLARPAMSVRVETVHHVGDAVWEVARATGTAAEVAGLAEILRAPPAAPIGAVDVVAEDARALRWVVRWDRPQEGDPPSPFHIVYDHTGPDAFVTFRIQQGRIEIRVGTQNGDALQRVFEAIEHAYRGRFDVRLVRVGQIGSERRVVPDEDRLLLAKALRAGYYDEPKRVGVRELGEDLGWSKTVISRKLRALERRAVELLAAD